jgi:hypothetical protein
MTRGDEAIGRLGNLGRRDPKLPDRRVAELPDGSYAAVIDTVRLDRVA